MMDDAEAAPCECGLRNEVFKHLPVLHFRNAYDGCARLHAVGAEEGDDVGKVLQFRLILHAIPCVGTVGEEIVVVLSGSMDGVEKIFKVVECHSVECEAFLLRRAGVGGKGDEGKKYEKQSFHSVAKEGYVWNGDTDAT